VLHGLDGVQNISGDIIIASRNYVEHEKHVSACLERLMKKGLTLNRNKCKFFQSSVEFFGSMFSERWCLRLQQYTFNTVYRPGADNPADYMSPHVASTSERDMKVTEEYINYVCETAYPKAL